MTDRQIKLQTRDRYCGNSSRTMATSGLPGMSAVAVISYYATRLSLPNERRSGISLRYCTISRKYVWVVNKEHLSARDSSCNLVGS